MTPLKIGDKATKTATLLMGMRNPNIAQALAPYGFNQAALDKGWGLFLRVTQGRLKPGSVRPKNPSAISTYDRFESEWFPVIKFVLVDTYPEVYERLFANLTRQDGKQAVISTLAFLERLGAMERGEAPYGEQGPQVREYLRSRGVTNEVVEGARGAFDNMSKVELRDDAPSITEEEAQAAEDAMGAWYNEWSGLARHAISDGNLLRLIGFKKMGRRRGRKNEVSQAEGAAIVALPQAAE